VNGITGSNNRFADRSSVNAKDEWLTPPELIKSLGEFDLDPCAPVNRPWPTAQHHYTIEDDGLRQKWFGRVWCNPPYGNNTKSWLRCMCNHNNGIALIFARTETRMFFDYIWNDAAALYFIKGRLKFYNVDGTQGKNTAGAPSVLVAYGKDNIDCFKNCIYDGKLVIL
jgi:hypothetical protein